DADDCFHGFDFSVVPAFRRGAGLILLARIPDSGLGIMNRRMQGRGVDHAWQLHVDGILCAAIDLPDLSQPVAPFSVLAVRPFRMYYAEHPIAACLCQRQTCHLPRRFVETPPSG